jgi:hypothetical protein
MALKSDLKSVGGGGRGSPFTSTPPSNDFINIQTEIADSFNSFFKRIAQERAISSFPQIVLKYQSKEKQVQLLRLNLHPFPFHL